MVSNITLFTPVPRIEVPHENPDQPKNQTPFLSRSALPHTLHPDLRRLYAPAAGTRGAVCPTLLHRGRAFHPRVPVSVFSGTGQDHGGSRRADQRLSFGR